MTILSPTRLLALQAAAHTKWAQTDDRQAATAPGRTAFLDRFERQVDPDGKLSPKERAKRAESAKKAHMLLLAKKSAEVRKRRKARATPKAKPSTDAA